MEPYRELERRFAKFTESEYAVSCNSGTSALHLALMALGVGRGDYVLVPDFTMAACGFAVSYTGAIPIFYTEESLNSYIPTKSIKAIMIVHVYGRLVPNEIWDFAIENRLPIIEDAAEAHGAVRNSKADMTCYSFYRNKIIHAEEGGIVTTNDKEYADRMNYLKNMAFGPGHDYFHEEIGYNYRMPDAEATLALKSLGEYRLNRSMREQIEDWYDFHLPLEVQRLSKRDAVWFYDVVVPDKKKALAIDGVRDSFKNLSSFPMYGGAPVREDPRVLLPVQPDMTEEDVISICKQL